MIAASVLPRKSRWNVSEFTLEVSGAELCRAAALRSEDALLLWLGAGSAPALGAVAVAMPAEDAAGGGGSCGTTLTAGGCGPAAADVAGAMARRLAARLSRPVHVCCSVSLDRFTAPLVERALVAEIKSRPDYFQ